MDSLDVKITIAGLQERKSFDLPCGGCSLAEVAAQVLPPNGGYAVTLNGKIVPPEKWSATLLQSHDELFFVPDFGFGIPEAIIAVMTWASFTIGPWTIYPVATAALLVGSYLLQQSLMPKLAGEGPSPSQAYSWDPKTTQQQGLPIARAYGKVRLHGNVVATHVLPSTDYKHLMIYALTAFCEGPVKSVSDIRLQDQAYTNFTGVTVETRRGLLDQTYISFFDKTRRCYKPNRVIKNADGAFTYQTVGNEFDDVEIILGLNVWYFHKSGGQDPNGVLMQIQVKKSTDPNYTTLFNDNIWNIGPGNSFIATEPFWRIFKLSDAMTVERGSRYDIKITKISGDSNSTRMANDVCFEFVNEVLNNGFTYPGMVLVGVAALRTEELPGSFDISAAAEGQIVDTYNGTDWVLDYSNNPAWVNYDVLTQPIISGGDDEQWLYPTTFIDPSSQWFDEPKAYDEDITTGAYDNVVKDQYSAWLELYLDSPMTDCSKVAFMAELTASGGQYSKCQVDVYYGGVWHNVFDSTQYHELYWTEVIIEPAQTVSAARIRVENRTPVSTNIHIYEFKFYHTITPDPPYAVEEYEGMDWERIVDADWYELAQHCDTPCPDGKGGEGTEPRITFNGVFDTIQSLWDAVLSVCEMARCIPFWRGLKINLAITKSKDRVGVLSVGNILEGSFEETFIGKTDRASELEVTYNDGDKDFKRDTLPIYSSTLTTYKSKVSLTPLGLSKQSEVWRYGKFQLAHNELLHRSIKAQGDIDCIGYHVGDRVGVQHDVPNWNVLKEMGCRGGGRLISYAAGVTDDTVILDCEIGDCLTSGLTYEIAIRLHDADAPVIKVIKSVNGSQVTIDGHFTGTKPEVDDLWAVGLQNYVLKDFIINKRQQSEEHQFVLEFIEYNEALWAADAADPIVPDMNAIAPRTERPLAREMRMNQIKKYVPSSALDILVADTVITTNLKWTDNVPSAGYISWTADDDLTPIVLTYNGLGYEITADSTNKEYIYWDKSQPNVFQKSDVKLDAVGEDKYLICHNEDGVAQPFWGGKLVPGQLLIDESIGPSTMLKAMQPFMHDLHFLPGDNASENKHNAVHWAAGTIKFSDGSTQTINAGQITGLGDGVIRYIYFSVGNNDLQNTSEYTSVATETTRLVSTIMVSSDTDQEVGILLNQNVGGNWIRDLLAPRAISSDQLKDFAVATKKTNLTSHQIY